MDQQLLTQEIDASFSRKKQIIIGDLKSNEAFDQRRSSILSKYNLFVKCYNHSCNRVDQKTMLFVPENSLFSSLDCLLSSHLITVLLIISALIPILGVFMIIYMSVASWPYFKALKIFRKNQFRVKDPFKNMKFDHIKCSQLKKNYHFITINFKSLNSQFNFKENINLAQHHRKSGQISEWMIYNEVFAQYYTGFTKYRIKLVVLMALTLTLSFASLIFFLILTI